ncbi:MAG: 1-acyl-sn-glycerol-3-phosphate acyltransferase [Candidatus Heimdallarchaeota archaeon]|nr:MAG: 1-acyl-sn-glycerol-3-phosphate acyltransferase [Candidatus Heimdallarchaeota archaeon]
MSITPESPKRWSFPKRAFYQLLTPIFPRIMHRLFRFQVIDRENAERFPEGRGVIFCINHQSHLDGPIILSTIITPFGNRKFLGFIVSGKVMEEHFLFGLLKLVGAIPIYRNNPTPTLNYVSQSLKEGIAILITPQGRRVHRTPFHDYFSLAEEGRTGVGRIILRTNGEIPVVPVYIRGTAEVLSPGAIKPRFGSYISISFGEPLYFHQYSRKNGSWSESDPDYYLNARKITDTIMNAIRDQMLEIEQPYLEYLEWKFNTGVEKITVSPRKEKEFVRFLRRLARVPPTQIKEYLDLKG